MIYKVVIEGQTLEMPEEIAGDDGKLKSALSPYFPGAANAKFMRSPEKEGVITVTVIKQAGTKGFIAYRKLPTDAELETLFQKDDTPEDQVLRRLIEATEDMNPVVKLNQVLEGKTLNQMGVESLFKLDSEINATVEEGNKEDDVLNTSLSLLTRTAALPSPSSIPGF